MSRHYTEADIKHYLQVLSETPQRIYACTDGLSDTRLKAISAAGKWSIGEHMAHVRGSSEIWTNSVHAMLTQDKPVLIYIHPRTYIKKQRYARLSFAENFEAFKQQRDSLLPALHRLSFADWNRSATFEGKTAVYTVFGEVLRMAGHELAHCTQVEAILNI